jgi:LPS sulfotransferase NodH
VLTRSRSGSNLLLSYLNSHPNVLIEGEIFGRLRGRNPLRKLKIAFGNQPRWVRAKGFKIFHYHPLDCTSDSLWNELEATKALRVIHLRRDNVLRTLLSRKVAEVDKVWLASARDAIPSVPREKVVFTVPELESGFVQTKAWESAAAKRFQRHSALHVTYEDLVEEPVAVIRRILAFLDLDYHEPRTELRKLNPGHLPDLIENYQELRQAFVGTPWLRFSED